MPITEILCPVRAVTSGPRQHFFGYYNTTPWDAAGRYLFALNVHFVGQPPNPADVAVIGLSGLATGQTDMWVIAKCLGRQTSEVERLAAPKCFADPARPADGSPGQAGCTVVAIAATICVIITFDAWRLLGTRRRRTRPTYSSFRRRRYPLP